MTSKLILKERLYKVPVYIYLQYSTILPSIAAWDTHMLYCIEDLQVERVTNPQMKHTSFSKEMSLLQVHIVTTHVVRYKSIKRIITLGAISKKCLKKCLRVVTDNDNQCGTSTEAFWDTVPLRQYHPLTHAFLGARVRILFSGRCSPHQCWIIFTFRHNIFGSLDSYFITWLCS